LLEASKEITTTGNEAMSKGTGKALVTSAPVLNLPYAFKKIYLISYCRKTSLKDPADHIYRAFFHEVF
jgi:hypothetical protein